MKLHWLNRPDTAILTVCAANLCRSPMAEGLLRTLLAGQGPKKSIKVASAGTHVTLVGQRPDPRAVRTCREFGIDIQGCRARQVSRRDFAAFDYILAMDDKNFDSLRKICPEEFAGKVKRLGGWLEGQDSQIPDPYFGSEEGFRKTFLTIEQAALGFVDWLC
jgi:low molecular weight protein-tyrosine phosphatase